MNFLSQQHFWKDETAFLFGERRRVFNGGYYDRAPRSIPNPENEQVSPDNSDMFQFEDLDNWPDSNTPIYTESGFNGGYAGDINSVNNQENLNVPDYLGGYEPSDTGVLASLDSINLYDPDVPNQATPLVVTPSYTGKYVPAVQQGSDRFGQGVVEGDNIFSETRSPEYSRGMHRNMDKGLVSQIKMRSVEKDGNGFWKANHQASLLSEDGRSYSELEKTWTQNGGGVLQANHGTRQIGNKSITEWLSPESGNNRAINSLSNEVESKKDRISKLEKRKAESLIYSKRANLFFPSGVNIPGLVDFSNGIDSKISDISSALLGMEYYQARTPNVNSEEKQLMRRYREFLEYQQDINVLQSEIRGIDHILNGGTTEIEVKIQEITDEVKKIDDEIKQQTALDLTQLSSTSIETLQMRKWRMKKEELNQQKSFYESLRSDYGALHGQEKAYERFFNTPLKNNQGMMDGMRDPAHAVKQLDQFYDWIETTVFSAGVPKPSNHHVKALLMGLCYRGELSPNVLSNTLRTLVGKNQIENFYNALGSVMSAENSTEKTRLFTEGFAPFSAAIGPIFSSLKESYLNWGNPNRLGDTHFEGNTGPYKRIGQDQETAFEKEHGFRISNAYEVWKHTRISSLPGNSVDEMGQVMTFATALPLRDWITADGAVNDSEAMKDMLAKIVEGLEFTDIPNPELQALYSAIQQKNWNPDDGKIINFVQSLQSQFRQYEDVMDVVDFDTTARSGNKFLEAVKGVGGVKPIEYLEYMGEELMDGNMMYWGFAGGLLWLSTKYSWLGKGLMWGTVGAIGNSVVEDLTGFNPLGEALDLVTSTGEHRAANPASWAMQEMKFAGDFEGVENERAFEIAGTVLGKCNLKEVLDWYALCKQKKQEDNPSGKGIYDNEAMPAPLRKNLGAILEQGGYNTGKTDPDDKAKFAFQFFEKYLKHIDRKENSTIGAESAEGGEQYLRQNFIIPPVGPGHKNYEQCSKEYEETGTGKKKGYRMEHVYVQMTSKDTIRYMAENNIPILKIFGNWGGQLKDFTYTHLREQFGSYDDAMKYMDKVSKDVKEWGWNVYNIAADEIMFRDKTGKAWKVVKNTAGDGWDVMMQGANAVDGFVKKHTGASFKEAWEWVAENTVEGLKWIGESVKGLNALFAGADLSVPPVYLGGVSSGPVELKQSVINIGIADAISKTYGIDSRASLEEFLDEATMNHGVQQSLQQIATARGSTVIESKDIVMYFFGSYGYGLGAGLQTGIDIVEFFASIANQGTQAVVGVLSDDAKAFLMEYDPSKLARVFPRDNIDGKKHFRDFISRESEESIDGGGDIYWTSETLQTYSDKKIREIFNGNTLRKDSPFYDLIINYFDSTLRVGINNQITTANSGLPPASHIPLLDRWEYIPPTRKENAIKFARNAIAREMADSQFRSDFIASLGSSSTATVVDNKIKDLVIKKLKEYDWTI